MSGSLLDRAIAVLREHEFTASECEEPYPKASDFCGECWQSRYDGHKTDCEWGQVLAEAKDRSEIP